MALPANWSTVALVGHLVTDANDPAVDYTVQVVSSQSRLQDSVSHRVIFPKVDEATPAAGSGYFRIPIVVSDTDTDITPAGRSHKVTLLSGGRPIQSWFVTVDHTQAVQLRFGSDGTIVQSGGTLADAIWVTDLAQFTDAPTVTPIGGGVTTEDLAAYFTKTEADGRFSTPASTAAAIASHVAASDPHSQYALDSDLTSGLAGKANVSALSAHTGNVSNPHSVTKTQVGLGNVADTAPADLPVSSATQSALDGKVDTSDTRLTNQRVPTDASVTDAKVASNAAISADKTTDGATNKVYTATEKNKLGGVAAGATANSTDAQLRDRSTHTGTQSADTVTDGSTNKTFLATERTKLSGIATGATANATDANLRDRATHTGTQASTTISDFTEAVQDAVAALLGAGSNVILNYDDAANTLTVSATASGGTGLDAEQVRDTIGVALVGAGNVAVVVNDAADTITISTTATVNATDAQLRDRSTHTGAQPISSVTGLQTALNGKTAVTVDGTFVASYDIDTTPVTYADIGGTVPTSALPPLAINDTFPVADQAAMLALTAQRGDFAIRADNGRSYVLSTDNPGTLADWKEVLAAGQVQSVAGKNGVVTLVKGDVGLGSVDNTADSAKPVSTAQQAALDLKAPLASPAFTGTPTGITKAHVGLGNVANTAPADLPISTATQAALDTKVNAAKALSFKTTAYTLALGDAGSEVSVDSTTGLSVTIPPSSSVAFPVGTTIDLSQLNTGQVTVAPGAGVTLQSRGAAYKLAGQHAVAAVRKIGTDTWRLFGDVVA